MGEECADICDRCGRTVVKEREADSSDMVRVEQLELMYLSDGYLPGELSRPSLHLRGQIFCPDCLVEEIADWVKEIKGIGPSQRVRYVTDA